MKFNLGKYLDAATNDSNYTVNNPANRLQRDMDRNWTDNDADYVVDCDILDFRSQGPTTTGTWIPAPPRRATRHASETFKPV